MTGPNGPTDPLSTDRDPDVSTDRDPDVSTDRDPDVSAVDVDEQLAEVERFIAAVQSGSVGTSEAMAAYRDRHRPAIERLRQELDAFEALLAPDLPDAG